MNDDNRTNSDNSGASSQGSTSGASDAVDASPVAARYGWLDDYETGNYDNLPHDEIYSGYRDWSRSANPDELYEGTYRGYQSLQEDKLRDAATDLHSYTQERGLDLSDLELSNPDYQQWSAHDLARVTGRAYGHSGSLEQEQPKQQEKKEEDKESGGVPKPLIGLALAGALAFAASRIAGGNDKKEDNDKKENNESTSYEVSAANSMPTRDYTVETLDTRDTIDTTQDYSSGSSGSSTSMNMTSDYGSSTTSDYGTDLNSDKTMGVVSDRSGGDTGVTSDYADDTSLTDDVAGTGGSGSSSGGW